MKSVMTFWKPERARERRHYEDQFILYTAIWLAVKNYDGVQ